MGRARYYNGTPRGIETKPYGFYPLGWDVNAAGSEQMGRTVFEAAPPGQTVQGYLLDDFLSAKTLQSLHLPGVLSYLSRKSHLQKRKRRAVVGMLDALGQSCCPRHNL